MGKTRDEIAGEYGSETIARGFRPSIEDYFRTTMRFGLGWDCGWLYATVTSISGQRYNLCRGYEKTASTLIQTTRLQEDLGEVSPVFKRLFVGAVSFDYLENGEAVQIKSYPARHKFRIEIKANHFRWHEEDGEVDLQFEGLGPALWFLNPGARIREDAYYTSELCRVSGKILGEPITGFGGLDQAWTPPGMAYVHGKIYLHLEDYWFVWANRYADGSTDYGVAFHGVGNWNLCFCVKDGQVHVSTENHFNISWSEEGYPLEIELRTGRHQFKWSSHSRTTPLKVPMQWATGQVIDLDRKDPPVESLGTIEYRLRD